MEYYKNKCQSKPKKVALGAVMRKLVNYIFAVLRDRKPYELRSPQEHAQMGVCGPYSRSVGLYCPG